MPTRQAFRTTQSASLSAFSTSAPRRTRVAILGLGAGGGIGQPLSLLLKTDPLFSSLILYDIRGVPGVAADISHIDVSGEVTGYLADSLDAALQGVKVVVMPAGVLRKPRVTCDDMFNTNTSILRDFAKAVSENAPDVHILIISNQVDSTVPIVAKVLQQARTLAPRMGSCDDA